MTWILGANGWYQTSGTGGGGGIPEAPTDGQKYARQNAGWSIVSDGAKGDTGDQGPTGPQGPQGATGAAGAAGADGLGWTGGSYDSLTGIVTFTSTDGLGFATTDLRGADGADGAEGPQGPQGIQGPQGDEGPTGPTGPKGAAGADGTDGTNGTNGLGWTGGSYSGATGIVTFTSNDGLGFSTGDLRGATGPQGPQGTIGPQGPAGADGADGAAASFTTGTWTPYFRLSNSDANKVVTYSASTYGRWTRLGNMVWVDFFIGTDGLTLNGASGNIFIEGFPFTNSGEPLHAACWSDSTGNGTWTTKPYYLFMANNNTILRPQDINGTNMQSAALTEGATTKGNYLSGQFFITTNDP